MDCWSFNPYQLFGSINKKKNDEEEIYINIYIYKMFTLDLPSSHQNLRAEKMKHMYRHLYMHPTKKGKPQITARGGSGVP